MKIAMDDRKVLATGATGSVIAAICCFTPVLVIALGAVGLSAWLGWIDYVLFPALALFLTIFGYGLYLRRRNRALACCAEEETAAKDKSMEKAS
jgi:mercuric ion transport protein